MMKGNKKGQAMAIGGVILMVVIFFSAMIILGAGFDKVEPSHLGVKVQYGKIIGSMSPGWEWTGLFTQVYKYDTRIRKVNVVMEGDFNAPDKTGQPIYATINVNYRLKHNADKIVQLYQQVGLDKDVADKLNIGPTITEGFKQATVKYGALEMLDKRQEVKKLAKQNIKANFPSEYFEITNIVISNIHFSKQFQDAIDSKKTAIELAKKAKEDLEKVKFEQQQEIEKYKAQAEQLRLQKNEISPLLIQKDWIEAWKSGGAQVPQFIISGDSGSNSPFLMNMDMAGIVQ